MRVVVDEDRMRQPWHASLKTALLVGKSAREHRESASRQVRGETAFPCLAVKNGFWGDIASYIRNVYSDHDFSVLLTWFTGEGLHGAL